MYFTVAPAQESMERLAQKKQQFDLIFLDADKPSYVQYYKVQYMNIPFWLGKNKEKNLVNLFKKYMFFPTKFEHWQMNIRIYRIHNSLSLWHIYLCEMYIPL